MALCRSDLENLINDSFPEADVKIIDLAGDNDHWSVEICCASFKGKSRIQQHKMVYEALGGKMGNELHALQLKTSTK
ncbi:BolA/IbaG family iron-sulfur metabolism protein [Rickettsiales bacterium]|nr:BolA/IbaG family iron-sulfur metabolism protein [Rickettsiales bacterium]